MLLPFVKFRYLLSLNTDFLSVYLGNFLYCGQLSVFNSHHPWPVVEMWPQFRGVPTPRVGLVLGFDALGLSLVS